MPIQLGQPPFRTKPLEDGGPKEGFFASFWERWLLQVWSVLVDTPKPSAAAFSGTYAGGGAAKDVQFDITLPDDTPIIILASIIQTWVTAVPNWQLQIRVDSSIVVDTGTIANQWQVTSTILYDATLSKGVHTIHAIWTAAANATLTRCELVCIPEVL